MLKSCDMKTIMRLQKVFLEYLIKNLPFSCFKTLQNQRIHVDSFSTILVLRSETCILNFNVHKKVSTVDFRALRRLGSFCFPGERRDRLVEVEQFYLYKYTGQWLDSVWNSLLLGRFMSVLFFDWRKLPFRQYLRQSTLSAKYEWDRLLPKWWCVAFSFFKGILLQDFPFLASTLNMGFVSDADRFFPFTVYSTAWFERVVKVAQTSSSLDQCGLLCQFSKEHCSFLIYIDGVCFLGNMWQELDSSELIPEINALPRRMDTIYLSYGGCIFDDFVYREWAKPSKIQIFSVLFNWSRHFMFGVWSRTG